jgi:hypothetical protein
VVDTRGNVLTARPILWSSSAPAVATVSPGGAVTALAAGTTTITATCDGVSQAALVTVTAHLTPVARVTLTPATGTVALGQTLPIVAELRDSAGTVLTGRGIIWTTSAPAVATISASGLVAPVTAGTAIVTATCEGRSAAATITVTADVLVEILNPSSTTTSGDTLYVVALVKPQQPLTGVFADIGMHHVQLVMTAIGALSGVQAWVAHIDITDVYQGSEDLVVSAANTFGATGSATVTFSYEPSHVGGGVFPDHKSKAIVPVVKPKVP